MKLGQEFNNFPVLERQKNMAINQCCVLIYTSGTTGNPKGIYGYLYQLNCSNLTSYKTHVITIVRFVPGCLKNTPSMTIKIQTRALIFEKRLSSQNYF